jgi:hypothetical protein
MMFELITLALFGSLGISFAYLGVGLGLGLALGAGTALLTIGGPMVGVSVHAPLVLNHR